MKKEKIKRSTGYSIIISVIIISVVWTIIIWGSLYWNKAAIDNFILESALIQSREAFLKDITNREWNASHGGVYVPVVNDSIQNPNLEFLSDRDIISVDGQKYTLIYPEYMSRLVQSKQKKNSSSTHIKSVNPISKVNKADVWEAKALKTFKNRQDEYYERFSSDSSDVLRFIKPLFINEKCLKCHDSQEYKVGQVKGGISITTNMLPFQKASQNNWSVIKIVHFVALAIGYLFIGIFSYISNRNRNLQVAIDKDKSYQLVEWQNTFDSINESLSIIDTEGRIIKTNKATSELIGTDTEDYLGKKCWELFHPNSTKIDSCPLKAVLKSGKTEFTEIKIENNWFQVIVDPIFNSDGKIEKAVHIVRDVTQIKTFEQKIIEERDNARLYLNLVDVIIVAIDLDANITLINKTGCKFLGYKEEEILGKNWFESFISETDRATTITGFNELISGNIEYAEKFENKIICSTSEEKLISWVNHLLVDHYGNIIGIISSGEDITTRRNSEIKLLNALENEKFYADIFRNASIAICVCNKDGKISRCNNAFEFLTGYNITEIKKIGWQKNLTPEKWLQYLNQKILGLETFDSVRYEQEIISKDEILIPVDVSITKKVVENKQSEYYIFFVSDITERKKAEKIIADKEKSLRLIVGNLTGVVYRCINDENWTMIYLSDGIESLTGWKREELIENEVISYNEIIHKNDRDYVRKVVDEANHKKEKYSLEYRIVTKTGEIKWVYEQGVKSDLFEDEKYIDGYLSDITVLKEAELALKENELKYRQIFENSTIAMWEEDLSALKNMLNKKLKNINNYEEYFDQNPELIYEALSLIRIVDVNNAAVELHHASSKAELLESLDQTFAKESFSVLKEEIIAIAKNNSFFQSEAIVKTLDGIPLNIIIQVQIPEKLKDFESVLVSMTNITELKRTEAKVTQNELMLIESQKIAKIGSWEWDFQTDSGVFSDGLYSVWGINTNLKISHWKELINLIPSEQHYKLKKAIARVRYMGEFSDQFEVIKPNGELAEVYAYIKYKRDENNKIIKMIGVAQDITERIAVQNELKKYSNQLEDLVKERTKNLEDSKTKLEKSQASLLYLLEDVNESRQELEVLNNQLEQVNKELESFSYSVSHDLRAPLRSIDGFSKALLEDYEKLLDSNGKDYLNRIRKNSQYMAHLIDDLLQLSKVSRASINIQSVDLTYLAKISISRNLEEYKHLEFRVNIEENVFTKGDVNLLQAVLDNLIGNAFKFSSKTENPKIEFGYDSAISAFFVKDNGDGFDMEYADKLFGAFHRLHTEKEFPGTGIGLATVKRIVLRHQGEVWADSKLNVGTTFYFRLGVQ